MSSREAGAAYQGAGTLSFPTHPHLSRVFVGLYFEHNTVARGLGFGDSVGLSDSTLPLAFLRQSAFLGQSVTEVEAE